MKTIPNNPGASGLHVFLMTKDKKTLALEYEAQVKHNAVLENEILRLKIEVFWLRAAERNSSV